MSDDKNTVLEYALGDRDVSTQDLSPNMAKKLLEEDRRKRIMDTQTEIAKILTKNRTQIVAYTILRNGAYPETVIEIVALD